MQLCVNLVVVFELCVSVDGLTSIWQDCCETGEKWKHEEEFIMCAFTSISINGEERSQCMICCELLANEK